MNVSARVIDLGPSRPKRRLIGLTPMIDVIFLLLVFFMLAARFSVESDIAVATRGGAVAAEGPPRIVDVAPAALRLNGRPIALDGLGAVIRRLASSDDALVAVRVEEGVDVQRLVDVVDALAAAHLTNVVFVDR